jgi:hypothetical protein
LWNCEIGYFAQFLKKRHNRNGLYQIERNHIMLPFWDLLACGSGCSRQDYQEKRLKFLKWMRDDLEARLAGLNAAIETMERQRQSEESA